MQQSGGILPLVVFAVVISATMYTILDLDNPRVGLIQGQGAAGLFHDLRDAIPSQDALEPKGTNGG